MSKSLQPHGLQRTRLLCPWNSPGENTGVGCHFLLLGDLPNSGIKPASLVTPAPTSELFVAEPLGKPQRSL